MNFTPLKDIDWKEVKYLRTSEDGPADQHPYKFTLILPYPLADWDVFSYWERERTDSMQEHLKKGDVLFDIGAEHGWLSVVYAQFVGADNMVLMEPTPEFWPNIKATWEKNGLNPPKGTYCGLIGAETKNTPVAHKDWPPESEGPLIDRNKYVYIHESGDTTPQITIDDYVKRTGVVPDALTMDTEGAEHLILAGAKETLQKHHPKVWVSIHPDLALRDYNYDVMGIHEFMESLGYTGKHLATDHEEHYYYE